MFGQTKAERECGGFRKFRHKPLVQQPVVGLQTTDPRSTGVEHQPEWVLGVQQRYSIVQQATL